MAIPEGKDQSPLFISYYTRGTLYEKEAEALQASCERLGIAYDIEGIDSLGAWDKNCCLKPAFILKKLHQHQRPVVWIDADAEILQKPTLFETLRADLAFRISDDEDPDKRGEIYGGTLFVNFTPHALEIVKKWEKVCALAASSTKDELSDQGCLRNALEFMKGEETVHYLPFEYCAIFDAPGDRALGENIVIVHYQASRLYKQMINGEGASFLHHLPIDELRALRRR